MANEWRITSESLEVLQAEPLGGLRGTSVTLEALQAEAGGLRGSSVSLETLQGEAGGIRASGVVLEVLVAYEVALSSARRRGFMTFAP